MVSTGGTDLREDIMRLYNTVHILVGTPGRILDLAEKNVAKLQHCTMVVMDEADKLLSPDFQRHIAKLLSHCHPERQILLFSATFPVTVRDFRDKHIVNAYEINLMRELTLSGVTQYYAYVAERQKVHCLTALFSKVMSEERVLAHCISGYFLFVCFVLSLATRVQHNVPALIIAVCVDSSWKSTNL